MMTQPPSFRTNPSSPSGRGSRRRREMTARKPRSPRHGPRQPRDRSLRFAPTEGLETMPDISPGNHGQRTPLADPQPHPSLISASRSRPPCPCVSSATRSVEHRPYTCGSICQEGLTPGHGSRCPPRDTLPLRMSSRGVPPAPAREGERNKTSHYSELASARGGRSANTGEGAEGRGLAT